MSNHPAPKHLTAEARKLWTALRDDYAIDDSAGLALLRAACEAHDRAQEARMMIKKDGMVSTDRFGQRKPHPAVQIERDDGRQEHHAPAPFVVERLRTARPGRMVCRRARAGRAAKRSSVVGAASSGLPAATRALAGLVG